MKFCKIIEIEETQVLFKLGMDDERENEQLQMITQTDGLEIVFIAEMKEGVKLSFEDIEREATKEKAQWLLDQIKEKTSN